MQIDVHAGLAQECDEGAVLLKMWVEEDLPADVSLRLGTVKASERSGSFL